MRSHAVLPTSAPVFQASDNGGVDSADADARWEEGARRLMRKFLFVLRFAVAALWLLVLFVPKPAFVGGPLLFVAIIASGVLLIGFVRSTTDSLDRWLQK